MYQQSEIVKSIGSNNQQPLAIYQRLLCVLSFSLIVTSGALFTTLELIVQLVRFTITLRLYDHVVHKGFHLLRCKRDGDQEFSGFLIQLVPLFFETFIGSAKIVQFEFHAFRERARRYSFLCQIHKCVI